MRSARAPVLLLALSARRVDRSVAAFLFFRWCLELRLMLARCDDDVVGRQR
jgi:hypothetical protein